MPAVSHTKGKADTPRTRPIGPVPGSAEWCRQQTWKSLQRQPQRATEVEAVHRHLLDGEYLDVLPQQQIVQHLRGRISRGRVLAALDTLAATSDVALTAIASDVFVQLLFGVVFDHICTQRLAWEARITVAEVDDDDA